MKNSKRIVSSAMAMLMTGSVAFTGAVPAIADTNDNGLVFPSNYSLDLVQPITDNAEVDALVDGLLAAMTEDEMYSFLGGSGTGTDGNAGSLPGVGRLGVPSIKMYDGPAGILYPDDTTNMPQEEMLAATWSEEMALLYGEAEGSENVAVGGAFALSAQLDIQRVPQFQRTKDQMGEDTYLLSSLADDLVTGMQEDGGIAVLKHYAAFTNNDSPAAKSDDVVSEQALHETYLTGFESAVKSGNALGIMSSYNSINGNKASSNTYLQLDVLRDMWGYQYFTITDWGGNDGYTMNKGTDIEMPMLSNHKQEKTAEQVTNGNMTQEEADETVRTACAHVLRAYGAGGYLSLVQLDENGVAIEGTVEDGDATIDPAAKTESLEKLAELYEENNNKIQTVAEEGGVLLKNENAALPLNTEGDNTVAVIGFTGLNLASGIGGERSYGAVSAMVSPYDELSAQLGDKVSGYVYEDQFGTTIPADYLYTSLEGTEKGVVRTYGMKSTSGNSGWYQGQMQGGGQSSETLMEGHELGEYATTDATVEFLTNGRGNYTNDAEGGTALDRATKPAYTWTTYLEAPESGSYQINFNSTGGTGAMTIYSITTDAETGEVKETSIGSGSTPTQNQGTMYYSAISATKSGCDASSANVTLEAGQRYKIVIQDRLAEISTERDMQLQLAWVTPSQKQANIDEAIEAAKTNDTVVVFAYAKVSDPGSSREATSLKMSASEQDKILKVAAAAKEAGNKVVVVMNNDSAVVMEDWIDEVDALLQMYYPGQRGGVATANLLTGVVNPSGRLAYTIPKKDDETIITISDEAWARFKVEQKSEDSGQSSGGMMGFSRNPNVTYYDEGILTGYRWYDSNDIEPQYDFGYGLSYTTFEYSDVVVTEKHEEGETAGYDVTFTVTNTGDVAGKDVAQIYLGEANVPEGIQSAEYQLAGYQKTEELAPGESQEITIHVSQRSLSYWNSNQTELNVNEDGTKDKWTVAEGERTIVLARSEAEEDFVSVTTVDVQEKTDAELNAEEAQKAAEAAQKAAEQAQKKAEQAAEKAEAAQAKAEAAEATATAKAEAAEKAAEAAATAEKNAQAAQAKAEAAQLQAEKAEAKAETAQAKAELAQAKAEAAEKEAAEKAAAAEAAAKKAEEALAAADKLIFSNKKTTVKATAQKKAVKVTWKKIAGAVKYQVKYSTKKSMSNAKTKTVKGTSVTMKNVKKGTTVYVKVRAYKTINGKKVYTKYSAVKSAKAK